MCWSHLRRDFRRHADGLAEQRTFGEHGLALTGRVFAAWRAYQHEHHDRDRLRAAIAPIQTELRALLQDASPKSTRTRWHRRFANNLLKIWPALWTFVTTDGVEPTNNPAERALRAPVIHRKVSLGIDVVSVTVNDGVRLVREPERDRAAGEHHEGERGLGGVEAVGAADDQPDPVVEALRCGLG